MMKNYVRQIKNTFLKSNLNKNIVFHKYNSKEDLIKAIKREQAPYIVCSKLGFAKNIYYVIVDRIVIK